MTSPTTDVPSGLGAGYRPPKPGGAASILAAIPKDDRVPMAATALLFAVLFAQPFWLLINDWWSMPEAGHGLLLGPVSVWFAWKSGLRKDSTPNVWLGLAVIGFAVLIRFGSGLAAELFMMRASMVMAAVGLIIYYRGIGQALHWWLPILLFSLSIPLPELVTQALALPLQFRASQMGAALLEARQIPVLLTGNVIRLPGHELFVAEACSGLRSLTALLSTAVLFGAVVLQKPVSRVLLVLFAIPVAILINGIRVFMTGFLVYFVSPEFGKGFMHLTEGWLLFLISLAMLGVFVWVLHAVEKFIARRNTV
jgi:exosortase